MNRRPAGKLIEGTLSRMYKLASYAAVASLHFRRNRLTPLRDGETLGDWAKRQSFDVERELSDEAIREHGYELSHEQVGKAIRAYLAPPSDDPDDYPTLREEQEDPTSGMPQDDPVT